MDNKVKLVDKFLSKTKYEKVCSYWIDIEDETDIVVYLVISNNITKYSEAEKIRDNVANDIKKWLDIDVYVGSISGGNCD